MNLRNFRPDTVDRIRPAECFRLNGKVWSVESVALAPTVARPARIAVTVIDPAGSMAQTGEVIYLDAGEIVEQTWDPRIDRPTADDLAQPAEVHLVVGPLNGVGLRAGGWIACDAAGDRPNPPLTQRTRDPEKATCADCLSAANSA